MPAEQTKHNMRLGLPPKNDEVVYTKLMINLYCTTNPFRAEILSKLVLLCPNSKLFAIC